eukprot:2076439-Rhodomonas_salina.1
MQHPAVAQNHQQRASPQQQPNFAQQLGFGRAIMGGPAISAPNHVPGFQAPQAQQQLVFQQQPMQGMSTPANETRRRH